jgi:hypothetical protein
MLNRTPKHLRTPPSSRLFETNKDSSPRHGLVALREADSELKTLIAHTSYEFPKVITRRLHQRRVIQRHQTLTSVRIKIVVTMLLHHLGLPPVKAPTLTLLCPCSMRQQQTITTNLETGTTLSPYPMVTVEPVSSLTATSIGTSKHELHEAIATPPPQPRHGHEPRYYLSSQ